MAGTYNTLNLPVSVASATKFSTVTSFTRGTVDGQLAVALDTGILYYWNANLGTWNVITGTSAAVSYFPEPVKELTVVDISNKQIALSKTPTTANKTRVIVIGGINQEYDVDFTVSGNILSWNGLGLDGVLEAGDKIIVTLD